MIFIRCYYLVSVMFLLFNGAYAPIKVTINSFKIKIKQNVHARDGNPVLAAILSIENDALDRLADLATQITLYLKIFML